MGLARMLRMYVAQQCFGLSDEGIEDAIYDSQAIRGFVGIEPTSPMCVTSQGRIEKTEKIGR
jgi:hypothetical protein